MSPRALSKSGQLTEAAWQIQVVGAARMYGWRTYHAPDGGGAPAGRGGRRVTLGQLPEGRGFPDLVLLRGPRIVVAELKTVKGRLGPGQQEWLDLFAEVGATIDQLIHDHQSNGRVRLAGAAQGTSGYPSVESYLWRPGDWEQVQSVLGRGQERRVDLDPLPTTQQQGAA